MPRSAVPPGGGFRPAAGGHRERTGAHRPASLLGIELPAQVEEGGDELHRIFIVVQRATGVNFTYYKYSTIKRRMPAGCSCTNWRAWDSICNSFTTTAEPAALSKTS